MMIYVASSWRNKIQPSAVQALEKAGHDVYDFRHPKQSNVVFNGFHWSDIDPEWEQWTPQRFRDSLDHPLAKDGFSKDYWAMRQAEKCVLVLPCGRSAHLEAGWLKGKGARLIIYLSDGEPELMYKLANYICTSMGEVIEAAGLRI